MHRNVYRFEFDPSVDVIDTEATLQVAILAAEGLFGESRVRMDVGYHVDAAGRVIYVDGGSAAGGAVARMFTSLITGEFGADRFSVRREVSHAAHSLEVAA